MGIKNVYDVAARAMSAQIVRMNTIASNLANANNVTSSEETAYKPLRPVFKTVYADQLKQSGLSTVDEIKIETLDREPIKTYFLAQLLGQILQLGTYDLQSDIYWFQSYIASST